MSLRSLSDSQILSRIQDLTRRERKLTLSVLLHLNEIERRRLHLKLGFQSLFDYCTSKLGYSASAAGRRIQTARCVARFPGLYGMLERNEVNLSTISQASRVLNDANHEELLSRIRGKAQREVEAILAECEPGAMPRDRVRTVVVRVPVARLESPSGAGKESRCAAESTLVKKVLTPVTGVTLETRTMLQFSVRKEFMAKLERVRSLAWHRLPASASLEQVFELALDLVIERQDPAKRIERREQRVERETRKQSDHPAPSSGSKSPRHIPAPVRDKVFQRDGGRCTFVGASGRRCGATIALQVDHIKPVARGGTGTPDNLRLLCAYHNRIEAERMFGPGQTKAPQAGDHVGRSAISRGAL